ncbi:EAL domain-containing protein [uncultured Cohaesibacter sp.]|uniref:EAL domain-containing protein n=1 Tax=uncultured Cohaesibacter sp. TaxID=1002546 RepID=UPI0029C6DE6F|nr:EAL domain-containing protein [uncultured Cohaesibacter sp.]
MFGIVLSALLVCAGVFGSLQVYKGIDRQMSLDFAALDGMGANIAQTLSRLRNPDTIEPCSSAFMVWLERIAYLPDGIHEIIYNDDTIACSVTSGILADGFNLGQPDIDDPNDGYQLWLDRDLQMLGHGGMAGTFFRKAPFTLVLPEIRLAESIAPWHMREVLSPVRNGEWRHRSGVFRLSQGVNFEFSEDAGFDTQKYRFWIYNCNSNGLVCVYTVAPLLEVALAFKGTILATLAFLFACAMVLSRLLTARLLRLWSFEARFVRTMSYDTIECFYQPLFSLDEDEICGVEVLVRWRDLDGSIVFPDKFLPIVEEKKLTRELTEHVVAHAIADLSDIEFAVEVPRVNINIFPQDFDAIWLVKTLIPLLDSQTNLKPVVEIVETSNLPVEETKEAISLLRASGIETYIDDFGVGYSSIHYLSALGADGVKLDRSFAMAPDGCLSKTMMFSAIEMINKTGLRLVVEGVEDRSRMMELRATNKVNVIQGYLISPPMPVGRLKSFLSKFHHERLQSNAQITQMHADIKAAFQ